MMGDDCGDDGGSLWRIVMIMEGYDKGWWS